VKALDVAVGGDVVRADPGGNGGRSFTALDGSCLRLGRASRLSWLCLARRSILPDDRGRLWMLLLGCCRRVLLRGLRVRNGR